MYKIQETERSSSDVFSASSACMRKVTQIPWNQSAQCSTWTQTYHSITKLQEKRSKYIFLYENRASKMNFFGAKEFFYMNFDFKKSCKNEFKDNNEKSCS